MMDSELFLTGFAPLIQLWAGICLLFFYQSLLKDSPFDTYRNKIRKLYDSFTMKYIAYLSKDDLPRGDEYIEDKWEDVRLTIKNMAILSFFYSTFILAFIGIETNSTYKIHYCGLQVMNIIVCIYLLLSTIFIDKKIFQSLLTTIIVFGGLILYYHFHIAVNEFWLERGFYLGNYFCRSSITVFTIFTCIGGVFLVFIRLGWEYCVLTTRASAITNIDKNFAYLADVLIGQKKISDLPKKMKKKVHRLILHEVDKKDSFSHDDLNRYIQQEISDEFNVFTRHKSFLEVIGDIKEKIIGLLPRK